jgi:hypothetical protein
MSSHCHHLDTIQEVTPSTRYVDEVMLDLRDRMTPQLGPIPRYY